MPTPAPSPAGAASPARASTRTFASRTPRHHPRLGTVWQALAARPRGQMPFISATSGGGRSVSSCLRPSIGTASEWGEAVSSCLTPAVGTAFEDGVPVPSCPKSSVGVEPAGGVPLPLGPGASSFARARQRARNGATTSSSLMGVLAPSAERTNSVSAPHTSPSPTFALPGSSAPSRSPSPRTSRTSARTAPPFARGAGRWAGQCRKAKLKRLESCSAHQAVSHQK